MDYVPFTSLKDLKEKVGYYLRNDQERDRIRMHGHAALRKYQNARIYWENIFEIIGLKTTRYQHRAGETWNKEYFDKWFRANGEAGPPEDT